MMLNQKTNVFRMNKTKDSPPGQEGWIQTERSECLETGWWKHYLKKISFSRRSEGVCLLPQFIDGILNHACNLFPF